MAANAPRTRHQPQNVNERHAASLSVQDRIALVITSAVGTMYAVYFFIVFLAGWMLWQGAIAHRPFDPYPFAFLLFIGNIVQLLLMPLIMVGQNIQGRHAELRTDEEYQTTLSSYRDVEEVMARLQTQEALLQKQSQMIEQLLARK